MAGNNALAKLYSWADGVKRRARNPMQTLALGLTQASEDLQQAATDADIAYGRNGMKSVLLSQQQKDEAAKRAAQFGEQMAMAAATVWHGSPHKFDKFDSSKIGTGEGAQAYGHGLYLAESPAVAGQYKKWLANYDVPPSAELGVSDAARDTLLGALKVGDGNKAAQSMRNWAQKAGTKQRRYEFQKLADMLDGGVNFGGGSLYKVDLPDDAIAKMLDWDKPLSQQAPEVQKALQPMFGPNSAALTGQELYKKAAGFDSMVNVASKTGGDAAQLKRVFPQATDAQIQRAIASAKSVGGNDRIAADMLRNAGVPGIRYLDGGSRAAGQGSSNFVVFPGNENLLRILERNGRALP